MMVSTAERIVKMETQIENLDLKISDHFTQNKDGVQTVLNEIKLLKKEIKDNYVTKAEFNPIRTALYSVVCLIVAGLIAFGFWLLQTAIEKGAFS